MQVLIDVKGITDKATLHTTIAQALSFPDWYGGNLDALFDCLTSVTVPTELTLSGYDTLSESLGSYANAFRNVLLRAAADNSCLTVQII